MKTFLLIAAMVFAAGTYEAAIPYFARTRTVTVTAPDKQNYLVVDAEIWKYSRPELSDVRLYDGQSQVPYVLTRQTGGSRTEESRAKILNLGSVAGRAEFDIDTSGFQSYDRVRLQLDAKNFINSAQVTGRRTLNDRTGTNLGPSTLYDFTKEGLGSNFVLKFPTASFPYLHVLLAEGIQPDEVKGAFLSSFSETRAAWTKAGECTPVAAQPKQSIFQCTIFDGMPVDRIGFTVAAGEVNFNRTVVFADDHGNEFQSGSISRVRMNRAGQQVTSEELALDIYPQNAKQIKVTIQNGDDPPLPIDRVQPLSTERRLYFDPKGKTALQLYYGDAKLEAPTYDYAKFFEQTADASPAQLGPAAANPQFAARPDDRPWSERHSYLLWLAMLLAVIVLGGLAFRGLKANSSTPVAK
jgi:uncharacterized protein DUF3999